MEIAWARLFFLYGPGEDERRLVPSVITALLNGRTVETTAGDQVRDFLHVDDAARGICAVATTRVTGPVNIAAGVPTTIRAVVNAIAEALAIRARPPWRPAVPARRADDDPRGEHAARRGVRLDPRALPRTGAAGDNRLVAGAPISPQCRAG